MHLIGSCAQSHLLKKAWRFSSPRATVCAHEDSSTMVLSGATGTGRYVQIVPHALRMRAVSYCNICVCACGSMLCPKTAATLCRADHFQTQQCTRQFRHRLTSPAVPSSPPETNPSICCTCRMCRTVSCMSCTAGIAGSDNVGHFELFALHSPHCS